MDYKETLEQVKSKASEAYSAAQGAYEQLNDRDRKILIVVACVLVLVIFGTFVSKGRNSLKSFRQDIEIAQKDLKEVQKLVNQYNANKEKVSTIERRLGRGQVNITTYLDNLARQNNIRLVTLQEVNVPQGEYYKEMAAKGTIADISIRKLVHFFYLIENGSQIMEIKRIKIKPKFKSPEYLKVNFWVSTYEEL
jgi:hypothetical protein